MLSSLAVLFVKLGDQEGMLKTEHVPWLHHAPNAKPSIQGWYEERADDYDLVAAESYYLVPNDDMVDIDVSTSPNQWL